MATFRKRAKGWYAEVYKHGVRAYATLPTKAQAKEWATNKEMEIQASKGFRVNSDATFHDAVIKYLDEVSAHKKSHKWNVRKKRIFLEASFANVPLSKLVASHITNWRDDRLKTVQSSTVNRELNFVSSVLNICRVEWGWIADNPVAGIKRPTNPRPRDRRISEDEIECMMSAFDYDLDKPISTNKDIVITFWLLAIETAMRLGEMCSLSKSDIHINKRYLTLRDSKNGDMRDVPLSSKAVELCQKILDADIKIESETAGAIFRKFRDRTGIKDLTFHDSRHEAITRLARKLDVLDLARMIGHRDPRSLMIYYNATASEIASRLD